MDKKKWMRGEYGERKLKSDIAAIVFCLTVLA